MPALNARPQPPAGAAAAPSRQTGTRATWATLAARIREGSRNSAMIAKDFITAKDFRTYKRIILR
jgi:hypothetical protein